MEMKNGFWAGVGFTVFGFMELWVLYFWYDAFFVNPTNYAYFEWLVLVAQLLVMLGGIWVMLLIGKEE